MSERRKENTAQVKSWLESPQFLRGFDDYAQYLDYLSVWYGNWSSCDPGHMECTDYTDELSFENSDYVCGFLVKDRSRAARRKSTALHKRHVKAISEVLSEKSAGKPSRKSDGAETRTTPSAKVYKRVSFPRNQCVVLTTWYDELSILSKTLCAKDFYELCCSVFDGNAFEIGYLCSVERSVGKVPAVSERAARMEKYAKLFSCETHHEKKRAKTGEKVSEVDISTEQLESNASENISGKSFVDRHVVGLKKAPALQVKLRESTVPIVMAKPQIITLVYPHVSTAGIPFRR